jgi:hypothetical protein
MPGEADPISRHGEPGTDSEEDTLWVLPHQVFQYSSIVDERVQLPAQTQGFCTYLVKQDQLWVSFHINHDYVQGDPALFIEMQIFELWLGNFPCLSDWMNYLIWKEGRKEGRIKTNEKKEILKK